MQEALTNVRRHAGAAPAAVSIRRDGTALEVVVRRALTNYLAGGGTDLAADLTPGASVSPPSVPLQLTAVIRVAWVPRGGSVVATVRATDTRGARYTLDYEIDVAKAQGRWEVSAIQTEPDA